MIFFPESAGQAPLRVPAADQSPLEAPAANPGQEASFSKPHPIAAEGPDQIRTQSPLDASTLAIVMAPGGSTVNLRAGARKRARLLTRVPQARPWRS